MTAQAQPFEGKQPKVEVIENEEEVLVRAELPGVKKKDLDVSIGATTVTINAKSHQEKAQSEGKESRSQVSHGTFSCTVNLSSSVDVDQAITLFQNGVLEVTLPRAQKPKPRALKIT